MARKMVERIYLKFSVSQLDRIIVLILNKPNNKKFISSCNQLFNLFDPTSYKTEYEKEVRVYVIKKLVTAILTKNITTKEEAILNCSIDGRFFDECHSLLESLSQESISDEEYEMISATISQQLKYSIVENEADRLIEIVNNIKTENYDDLESEINRVEEMTNHISVRLREAKNDANATKYDCNLSDVSFVDQLQDIINEANDPSSKIKTGLQMFNMMLDGGFEKGRVYTLLAMAKGFKSGLMLNCAIYAKKYNKLKPKDPTKIPCIVYLSMENSTMETNKRILTYAFGNEFIRTGIKQKTGASVATMLEQAGIFTPNDPESPEIRILYRPNRSITTADIYTILDDLGKEGRECVFFILDYVKRIRCANPPKSGELRLEMGEVINDLCSLAKDRDIPVLTASQLNREAFKVMESAGSYEEKIAAATKLGASQVGESIDIIQNSDVAIALGRINNSSINENGECEYNDRYLFVKCIASRNFNPPIEQFQVRFSEGNDLRLIEDIYEKTPLSTITTEALINDRRENRKPNQKQPVQISSTGFGIRRV